MSTALYWRAAREHNVLGLRGLPFPIALQSNPISGKARLLAPSRNLTGLISTLAGLSAVSGMPALRYLSKSY